MGEIISYLQVNDEVAKQDLHMDKIVIGEKMWGHFDYDTTR